MPLDLPKLRKLLSLDPNDPLSRFALARKLFEDHADDPASLAEAAEHLQFANERAPEHLATYHIYSQVLLRLGRRDEARRVLQEGIQRVKGIGEGMGRDLGPAMEKMLAEM